MRTSNGQFAPGESGNPGGRPKGQSITAKLRTLLDNPNASEPGKSNLDKLAEVVLEKALEGDLGFAKMVWERVEGRIPDADSSQDSSPDDVYRQAAEILLRRRTEREEAKARAERN